MKTAATQICLIAGGLALATVFPADAQRRRPISMNDRTALELPGWDIEVSPTVTTTQVSGDAGTGNVVTGPAGTVLVTLTFYERMDRPCRVVLNFGSWSLDADQDVNDAEYSSRQEGSTSCSGSEEIVGSGAGNGFSGIQICQRAGNDRIKGARTRARQMVPGGGGVSGGDFVRSNCNEWQAWVDCDEGHVATGAVVHWNDAAITGIALRCSSFSLSRQARDAIRVTRVPRLTTSGDTPGSAISGLAATEQILNAPSPNMALRKLTYGERNDRPCYLQAEFWTDNPEQGAWPVTFNQCNGSHTSNQSIEIPSTFDAMQLASSIVACQRSQNDRLKGIRLIGSRIDASGATPDLAIQDEHERPNCNDWNPPAHCNQGSVITGVRVHFRPASNQPAEIVGLGVNCGTARRQ